MVIHKKISRVVILLLSILVTENSYAIDGDVRIGFFNKQGVDDSETRIRARIGHTFLLNNMWNARTRFATRQSNDSRNDIHFEFFRNIPDKDGLRRGDATIDELYVEYSNDKDEIRIGRQQTKMELEGVAKKSLDRNNSPNTDITWTDGVYWKHKHKGGAIGHAIIQYNTSPNSTTPGSTEVRRTPLNFSDSGSRISTMIGIEKKSKTGLWAQSGFDINYLPNSLHTQGVNAGKIEDYWAVVGRLAVQWPLNDSSKFLLAGELGLAPNTPDKAVFNLGTSGSTDGAAWQTSFNFIDFKPHHSIGLVVGRVDAGWLLSPDFRNNNTLIELRYRWAITKVLKLEARARRREEIDKPTTSLQKRVDEDSYLRLTWKF